MKRTYKNKVLIRLTVFALLLIMGCNNNPNLQKTDQTPFIPQEYVSENNPIATIQMQDHELPHGGKIVLELFPEAAPNTVANFIHLAKTGYYDGSIFYRVVSTFMIQGGDASGEGLGGPGYSLEGEFASNGFTENQLDHKKGVVTLARAPHNPNSGGSQFIILLTDAPHMNGQYAGFGKVIAGMDVVDKLAHVDVNPTDRPLEPQVIETITVDTKGTDYGKPKTLPDHGEGWRPDEQKENEVDAT